MLKRSFAFCFLFAISLSLHAQTPSGEISGVVADQAGSVVAGVKVMLTNIATNAPREVQTNDSGLYAFPALPPGIYTLKVEKAGFRAIERKNIEVLTGSANRIDLSLEIGELTNVVEVTGGAPILQSENASIGTVIENRAIVELPLNGRNYLQLASLIPGATTNGPSSSQGKQRMGGQRNSFALNVLQAATAHSGQIASNLNATTGKRGVPNPAHPCWLMGFPVEWLHGAASATLSCHSWQPK